jgi:hypothetical protein
MCSVIDLDAATADFFQHGSGRSIREGRLLTKRGEVFALVPVG